MLDNPNNAKLYYRIIFPNEGENSIRDAAKINSTGTLDKLSQHIEAFIQPDRFMPIFNFSLYRTQVGGEGDRETIQGFYRTQETSL